MTARRPLAHTQAHSIFLAIGVLTRDDSARARLLVRTTWWSTASGERNLALRFLLTAAMMTAALREEQRAFADLLLLPHTLDGNRYSSKAFAWLQLALREWQPRFVALVDDDAYIHIGAVLGDLRLLSREQRERNRVRCMVYGGVEFYALERNTGQARFYGYNARQAAFRYRFSHGLYIPRAERRKPPHAQRIEARRRWAEAKPMPWTHRAAASIVRERWLSDALALAPSKAARAQKNDLSLPFVRAQRVTPTALEVACLWLHTPSPCP